MVRHKRRYWKCVDCGSEINDECMREVRYSPAGTRSVYTRFVEFCDGCVNYNPEVVIAYD